MKILKIIKLDDAQITDPSDELYDLQKKYNVKISRSNQSNAIYIFRSNKYRIRIGHYITENQKNTHLWNFQKNIIRKNINKNIVEKEIQKHLKYFK